VRHYAYKCRFAVNIDLIMIAEFSFTVADSKKVLQCFSCFSIASDIAIIFSPSIAIVIVLLVCRSLSMESSCHLSHLSVVLCVGLWHCRVDAAYPWLNAARST